MSFARFADAAVSSRAASATLSSLFALIANQVVPAMPADKRRKNPSDVATSVLYLRRNLRAR
jgi:hypothetical protein